MNTSGWTWSDTTGVTVSPATQGAWDDFVKQYPDAEQFENKGWPFHELMAPVMPNKAKGSHVFRPASVAARSSSPEWDENQFNQPEEDDDHLVGGTNGAGEGSEDFGGNAGSAGDEDEEDEEDDEDKGDDSDVLSCLPPFLTCLTRNSLLQHRPSSPESAVQPSLPPHSHFRKNLVLPLLLKVFSVLPNRRNDSMRSLEISVISWSLLHLHRLRRVLPW